MQIKCDNKKFQYMLSLSDSLVITIHYFIIDSKCSFDYFLLHTSGLLILTFMWNRWLYDELTEDGKLKFSYEFFQCILTITLIVLFVFSLYLLNYKPERYTPGIC